MKETKDKNGKVINIGDSVQVPEPNDTDIHNFEFVGTVADIYDDGTVGVIDQENDFFEIEAERLEIVKD